MNKLKVVPDMELLSPPNPAGVRNLSPLFISADEKTLVYNQERRLTDGITLNLRKRPVLTICIECE